MKKRDLDTTVEYESTPEEKEQEALKKAKRAKHKKRMRVLDRVFGFLAATGIVFGVAALCLEYIIVKGPSEALRDVFINTMDETRRFRFIPNIFLSADELTMLRQRGQIDKDTATDTELISIPKEETVTADGTDAYGLKDEDGDGIVFLDIRGNGYVGYMTVILDPKRVFVGMPVDYGGVGLTLEEMCKKYDAIGGINAGAFKDEGGAGLGGLPEGITIIDGYCYNDEYGVTDGFVGFDKDGILHVGYYTYEDCVANNIVNGVSFGPILISNGVPTDPEYLSSGVNPRTAIGQRADGAVIMLVIDGRQVHSMGATYQDVVDIMMDYGAVNAFNLDGGSSTTMYYQGKYVNSCSAANGVARPLPDAFLYK